VDGLELDVRLSNDGVVVVHHDRDLRRTTNLSGPVDRYSADELARADAAFTFGPTAPGVDADVSRRGYWRTPRRCSSGTATSASSSSPS
jgi:glycerophosphoryl diester phosphodiesterase